MLIEYYKKYTEKRELKPTKGILKWTNQYKEDTDIYLQFLNENTEDTNDEKDKIHSSTLYGIFKDWYKYNNPNVKIPSSKEFGLNMRKYKEVKDRIRIGDKVQQGIEKCKLLKINNE